MSRKHLKKVVLKKLGKQNRSKLLNELKQCQLDDTQVGLLHSTSSMQTRGLKNFIQLENKFQNGQQEIKYESKRKYRRKQPKLALKQQEIPTSESDSNSELEDELDQRIVGLVSEPINGKTEEEKPEIEKSRPVQSEEEKKPAKTKPKQPPQPAIFVLVDRLQEVVDSRSKLPIIGEEHTIVECIRYNDVVIVSGETGSGKTTQIPQFLYEAGYTLNGRMIGITEPRRVAAVSMSERVGYELNLPKQVSHQIRFQGTTSEETKIKFMTDGVLLRECKKDFLLSNYSVIIIDEAHERSVFSDILIGLLSRIVPLRRKKGNPLKLIIMSATLRVNDFIDNKYLFKISPPVITIESRQYPVVTKFARNTPDDFLDAAYKKVYKIHTKTLKEGISNKDRGILVFVTSQMDIKILCHRLKKKLPTLHCLGLYAMLAIEKQKLVFRDPPKGKRLCVIATNVAETSITIPNIKYVVDCGQEKRKIYNPVTGVSTFIKAWTSKASAEQRAGRAGRVGPGFCFRLYSSAVFTNDFPKFSEPQILLKPIDDILLQMKALNIHNVISFPFPTPPSIDSLKLAEQSLITLGALDDSKIRLARFNEISKVQYSSKLTSLGKAMSSMAISARCSKMIILSPNNLLQHVINLVAAMSVREMFVDPKKAHSLATKIGNMKFLGDFMTMLCAVIEHYNMEEPGFSFDKYGLRAKAMMDIVKFRKQLIKNLKKREVPKLRKLSESQIVILSQVLLSSFCDHIAKRIPDTNVEDEDGTVKRIKNAYECTDTNELVYISSESILKMQNPEFVMYRELYHNNNKTYMRDIAQVDPNWFPFYAEKLCNISPCDKNSLISSPEPQYDKTRDQITCIRQTSYGPRSWDLGFINVPMHLVDDGIDLYKQFAYFLLVGEVFDWFQAFTADLLTPPTLITKAWSKLHPRTSKLLNALVGKNVKSKRNLIDVWKTQPQYLQVEFLAWLPETTHYKVMKEWDKLVSL